MSVRIVAFASPHLSAVFALSRPNVIMPLTRSQRRSPSQLMHSNSILPSKRTSAHAELDMHERKIETKLETHRVEECEGPQRSKSPKLENLLVPRNTADETDHGHHEDSLSGHVKGASHTDVKREVYMPLDIEDDPFLAHTPVPPSEEEARNTTDALRSMYNRPLSTVSHSKTQHRRSLLDNLVATVLSQATTNTNSSRAFRNLKATFPKWEQVIDAGPSEIERCIKCGGLAEAKSKVIHQILLQLKEEQGSCTLEFIRDMKNDEAKKKLCMFRGVGPKTASCVLMFGMRRGEFPVDTHIRRISARLGWTRPGSTAESTYDILNGCLPDDIKYDLHVLLIEHGREICKARRPQCGICSFQKTCPWAAHVAWEAQHS